MGVAGLMLGMWLVGGAEAAEPKYVLVKADAPVFAAPDADEDKTKLAKHVDVEEDPHRVFYAELLERHEGWVKVRTANYRSPCYRPLLTNAPVGMEVWVRPNALVPAITRKLEMTEGDTKVVVFPGVSAIENVDASITVGARGLSVSANFPVDAVGPTYRPGEPQRTDFAPSHATTGVFGNDAIKIEVNKAPAQKDGAGWAIERRCVRVSAPQVSGEAPDAGDGTPDVRTGTARRIKNAWALKPGTPLVWPDGLYAGKNVNHYRLEQDKEEDPTGLVCGNAMGLTVCAPDPAGDGSLPGNVRHVSVDLKRVEGDDPKHPKGDVKGQSAKCRVQIDTAAGGKVQDVQVRGCPAPFHEAVKEAASEWKYKALTVDGKPVPARTWTFVKFEG